MSSLDFELWPISAAKQGVSATKYWLDVELPGELSDLSMMQLTALRKMVVKAFNEGKKAK